MFSGEAQPTLLKDAEGRYFIDRDSKHFGRVLNFLRDAAVVLPTSDQECQELRAEAEFYNLTGLAAAIDERQEATAKAMAAKAMAAVQTAAASTQRRNSNDPAVEAVKKQLSDLLECFQYKQNCLSRTRESELPIRRLQLDNYMLQLKALELQLEALKASSS
ncbi:BTB POZ domain-containing adapter for CUL3-mediated degradation 3 isoform X2 [Chlorella sorokiniana]|uniref:BTB POZ domain-containing adapter for CUL3-mediated degradation 3 isoform X2 n=1 Tax=Chlorella sorokiniana TaxID=3076 RepID=A0A2P6TCX2_CHLSO|nr:BTB POZ domain-containing adapter for CUL3-mediated degradation 3 isoform X2 [Chlorella sorokiniana]|eukprot:PRW20486.1 BTB POZ domain-containing adapter for CUL3-mediated degradation 3 isoform X2 [Chlorella sorokiniana]